ncbi:MAG: SWIM zinc finger family protein, partial [Rhodobacteraceae bacterium]|nr:SWIM zinc finger family protein [Paracoccaceae bacterium]
MRRLLGEPTASRGLAYAQQGRVRSVKMEADGLLAGEVQGHSAAPYVQYVRLGYNGAGVLHWVDGTCDCPMGRNCKHVAAAVIAWERAGGEPAKAAPANPSQVSSPTPLASALQSWLARVRQADEPEAAPADGDPDAYPATVRDRLLYVVELDRSSGRLVATPMKATLRKDGTLGKTMRRYDTGRLSWEGTPAFIRPIDLRILYWIEALGLRGSPYNNRVPPERGAILSLLGVIAETGRGYWGEPLGPVLAIAEARNGKIDWAAGEDGIQRPRLIDAGGTEMVLLPIDPPTCVEPSKGTIGPIDLDMPPKLAMAVLSAPDIPPEAATAVAEALGTLRHTRVTAPKAIRSETRAGIAPTPVLRLFALTLRQRNRRWGGNDIPITLPALRLDFDYAGRRVAAFPFDDPKLREGDSVVTLRRNRDVEKKAHQRLAEGGADRVEDLPHFTGGRDVAPLDRVFDAGSPEDADFLDIGSHGDALAFTVEEVPRLRAEGWRVEIDPTWPYRLHEGPVEIRMGLDSGGDGWLSLGVTLMAEGERLDLAPLIGSIIQILPLDADGALDDTFHLEDFLEDLVLYQRLSDGKHVPLPGETLAPLVNAILAAPGLLGGFHPAEAARLPDLADALEGCGIPFDGGSEIVELGRKLRALAAQPMAEPPAGLLADLRPYQRTGYGWLRALADTGFGGVLADDMGLGKTLQTLALLVERHLVRGADRPSLLVVPTSLVGSWRREAARFAPDLRVLVLHGADRHDRVPAIPDHHLVITTYPLLRRDHAGLFGRDWEFAILDEAQAVKNPAAATSRHIRGIKARTRIALTGTPLENSLEDLWALFDWLVPGLLGDRKGFRTRFRTPIERDGNASAQLALNSRIRPFLLRRTKGEVASDLPPKSEFNELIALGDEQRALYETIRLSMDARVRDAIATKGLAASRITILDALLKLRQVCCDPALLKQTARRPITESAKRDRLMEMLEALIVEGRRVLVFSQFVTMLDLIERDVRARGWDYAKLTGQTKDRETLVAEFQGGAAPVFLISLKAGGVGLTLTAADTVILYDPWWNPAV